MAKKRFNVAVIPGDGIGKEVIPEGLRVLQAAIARFDINLHFDHFDFSSYDYYVKHGQMMPGDWKQRVGNHDAIYLARLAGLKKSLIMYHYGDRSSCSGVSLINM